MGPSAIRYAELNGRLRELGLDVDDWGDVGSPVPETTEQGSANARYLGPIKAVCEQIAGLVNDAVEQAHIPLTLGGDHSIAMGTLGGMAKARGPGAALWIDAHGDLNRPATSPTGNVHGMPLAALLGEEPSELSHLGGWSPKVLPAHTVLVGIRDLDEHERAAVRSSGARVFTMKEVDRLGIVSVMEQAIDLAGTGTAGLHVSFDMDACDPTDAPGVGTPVRGGLSYREAHMAMEILAESGRLTSLDVVEVNPALDVRNTTAELGTELILSALGLNIL
jgi:arginase